MKRRKYYVGQKLGKLTLLERKTKNGATQYHCRCECGVEKNIFVGNLKDKKDCGCGFRTRIAVDHSGARFGRLLVVKKVDKDRFGNSRYLCRCDCKNEIIVLGCSLTKGDTKSCGCYRKEVTSKNRRKLGGVIKRNIALFDTYAKQLLPMEKVRRYPRISGEVLQVICYNCKKWFTPKLTDVKRRIMAISGKISGEQHFYCSDDCKHTCDVFWQITRRKSEIVSNRPYVDPEWRHMALERDGYECQICGSKINIDVHHIEPATQNPILSNDVDNAITLCKNCHYGKVHKNKGCRQIDLRC